MISIVLHEPEIPGNTGNIGRTCVATGSALHLIEPLGFHITEKNLRRAGMDYWPRLDVHRWMNYEAFLEAHPDAPIYFATTKARQMYTDVQFEPNAFIMFGKESAGIPEVILVKHPERCIRIPMVETERSLNLSNSVAVVLYEALRQNGFPGLSGEGHLHNLDWQDDGLRHLQSFGT
ncbi:MAG: tRNA (cytidine(34)-2'-O)-methyltransferase [Lachnospiraceae bacterium]|nr:tRNA (cytidine(34)-2'-O)-methyltransferase [Lachnospiraceae bacterium]